MPAVEKIREYLSQMPAPYQAEVLHYVEFLWGKLQDQGRDRDDLLWQELSLASALRDMDEEDEVTYNIDDLKEKF
jgi:hypothetical protein